MVVHNAATRVAYLLLRKVSDLSEAVQYFMDLDRNRTLSGIKTYFEASFVPRS